MLKSQLIKNRIQKGFEAGNSKIADKLLLRLHQSCRRQLNDQRAGSTDCPLDILTLSCPSTLNQKTYCQ